MIKPWQKYITNISALQFIQLLRFATLFLIGMVFVRYYSSAAIGYYETLLFMAGAVSFFWLRGVLQSFLSLLKGNDSADSKNSPVFFNGFVLLIFFSAVTVVVLVIFKHSLLRFLNDSQPFPYFNWLLLYLFFGSPANFIEYVYLGLSKPKKIMVYGIVSYALQFSALIVPAILGYPLLISVQGLVLVNVLRFLWLVYILFRYSRCKISWPFIKNHLNLAVPLIGSALLSGSAPYIDGAIVTRFYDETMFAIFRYGAREFPIAVILANALSNAMLPEFGQLKLEEALEKLKRNARRLMHLLFPVTLVLIVTTNWLFPILFTQEFAFSAKIFNVYLLLIISRLLFPQTILMGMQRTRVFLWVSLTELMVNVGLSLVFIQFWGILGIAYATIVANFIDKALLMLIVKRRLQVLPKSYIPISTYVIYLFFTVILYYFVDYIIY